MPYLKDLTVEFVSLVDRAAVRDPSNPTEAQRFLLWKSDSGTPTTGGSMTPEETAAALTKAEQERDELATKVAKLEKKLNKRAAAGDEPKADKIDKSALPTEVREALEKAETAERAALAKAEEAERIAKEERETRVTREFVQKAEAEFSHVAGETDAFGKLLKSASENLTEEEYGLLEQTFKAAEARVSQSELLKSYGVSGDPAPATGGSVELTKLEKTAADLKKADPSLSGYEAMQRAMRENRDAQAAYLAGVR